MNIKEIIELIDRADEIHSNTNSATIGTERYEKFRKDLQTLVMNYLDDLKNINTPWWTRY